ncbi:hypothetical protein J6590_006430 [Homalodisca vitripennis]|nr:hypothetical protein J6590_006430 [Homalodisca vitripennis]
MKATDDWADETTDIPLLESVTAAGLCVRRCARVATKECAAMQFLSRSSVCPQPQHRTASEKM